MKTKLPLLALLTVMALAVASSTPAAAGDDAAATFKAKCAMCHGADATGKTPMGAKFNIRDLTSPDVQKQSDAELATVITKGRNKMPEYGTKLSKDQINDLAKFVHTLGKK